MHDRPRIIQLHIDGHAIREISRDNEISRNAIRRALAEDAAMTYHRPSTSEEYEPAVRDVLADFPRMSVPDIATMIDWPKSRRQLSDLVASLRPEYLERHEADATLSTDVLATDMHRLKAGQLAEPGTMAIGLVEARELTVQEVDWWMQLEKNGIPV